MVQINIDEHAYKILVEERDNLKEQGIGADISDAIRSLKAKDEKN